MTFDDPVFILNETSVTVEVNGDEIEAKVVADPSDPRSVLLMTEGGRWVPGADHRVIIREGAVVNASEHYLEDELDVHVVVGPRPNVFVATTATSTSAARTS